jgi:uncharacterized protein (TIGR00369 family)
MKKSVKHSSAAGHDTKHVSVARNRCFGCGPDNPDGMRLKFALDEQRKSFVCHFRLSGRYVGPPGHAHGGVIATILDEAMGKANKLKHVIALTREMMVEYLRPVPLGKRLVVEGRNRTVRGRTYTNVAEIKTEEGEVLARSRGKFVAIDPEKMFAKYLPKSMKKHAGAAVRSAFVEPNE